MRALIQRVTNASCKVNNKIVGKINNGLLVFVAFTDGDTDLEIDYMVDKIINLRIFDDDNGVMNKSLLDTNGSVLSISQFTLYADCKKGRRPNYIRALSGDLSTTLYDKFNEKMTKKNVVVETGLFGADMKISLVNDGPVTIMLEKENINGKK